MVVCPVITACVSILLLIKTHTHDYLINLMIYKLLIHCEYPAVFHRNLPVYDNCLNFGTVRRIGKTGNQLLV